MSTKNILCIAGLKGSGKDESAKMLQFCLNAPKFMQTYWVYKHFNIFTEGKFKICRFADTLKSLLSILLNVDVEKFEDRQFKEEFYVDFNTLTIHHKNFVDKEKILADNKFSKLAKDLTPSLTEDYWLSVRQVLQYFGTEIMRYYFGDKLWILTTYEQNYKNMIVSDLRFKVEFEESKKKGGKVIYIHRPECKVGSHASERELMTLYENKNYDYLVNNDGSLSDLFYKIKNISKVCLQK